MSALLMRVNMMNYFLLAFVFLNIVTFRYSCHIWKLFRYFTLTSILPSFRFSTVLFIKVSISKINTKSTLALINRAIIYLLFIRNSLIHTKNLTMHTFADFSNWSWCLIFLFALVCDYSSPHIPQGAELVAERPYTVKASIKLNAKLFTLILLNVPSISKNNGSRTWSFYYS